MTSVGHRRFRRPTYSEKKDFGPSPSPILECSNVSAKYGRIRVCEDIGFQVQRGEVMAILGPNGAGKTSLLGAISGRVEGGGVVVLGGRRIDNLKLHARAKAGLALVPEFRGNCFGPLSVRENLQLGARLAPRGDRERMVVDVLDLFPVLKARMSQRADSLSGGEQQMLAIGMALVRGPDVLLLDEPTQGLAPTVLHDLVTTFGELGERGIALVVAEQNHDFAADIADLWVLVVGGNVVSRGTREQLDRKQLADLYLGSSVL